MMLIRLRLAIAISATTALATYTNDFKLNTYWRQSGNEDTLGQYCASAAINYVTLAFVNNSPEHGKGTDYPGMNFASHCATDFYVKSDQYSKFLSGCTYIEDDIKTCQDLGKKVLLSIGGEYSVSNDYSVSSEEKGREFADFMFDAFGPFVEGYEGPRPFDKDEMEHTCIAGFDFDIESKFEDQAPYVAMVKRLHERIKHCDKEMILPAAPQCPLSDEYFQMKTLLQETKFDKIWVYDGFNYNDWARFIEDTPNRDSELFIGLIASPFATNDGTGYVAPGAIQALICEYKRQAHFGGVMLWDANYAERNINSGKSYCENAAESLRYGGCPGDVSIPSQPVSSSIVSVSKALPSVSAPTWSSSFSSEMNDASSISYSVSTTSTGDENANRNTSSAAISSILKYSESTTVSSVMSYTSSTAIKSDTRLSSSDRVNSSYTTITVITIITHTVTPYTLTVTHYTGSSGYGASEFQSVAQSFDQEGSISSSEPLTSGPALSGTRAISGFDFGTTTTIDPIDASRQGSTPASSVSNHTSSSACVVGVNCTNFTIVRTMSVYPVPGTDNVAARSETRLSDQEVFETIAVAEGKRLAALWLGALVVTFVLVVRLNYVLENLG
ncbi:glycoside hydrolase superfamily [Biscogniauxia marginata]|nr:glycoside hydrolase superfamily [Biscogniauxia marginata]